MSMSVPVCTASKHAGGIIDRISVDELVSFINGSTDQAAAPEPPPPEKLVSSKAAKRQRQKARKVSNPDLFS